MENPYRRSGSDLDIKVSAAKLPQFCYLASPDAAADPPMLRDAALPFAFAVRGRSFNRSLPSRAR